MPPRISQNSCRASRRSCLRTTSWRLLRCGARCATSPLVRAARPSAIVLHLAARLTAGVTYSRAVIHSPDLARHGAKIRAPGARFASRRTASTFLAPPCIPLAHRSAAPRQACSCRHDDRGHALRHEGEHDIALTGGCCLQAAQNAASELCRRRRGLWRAVLLRCAAQDLGPQPQGGPRAGADRGAAAICCAGPRPARGLLQADAPQPAREPRCEAR